MPSGSSGAGAPDTRRRDDDAVTADVAEGENCLPPIVEALNLDRRAVHKVALRDGKERQLR